MSQLYVSQREELKNAQKCFEESSNYQKILRFGDDALKKEIDEAFEIVPTSEAFNE